LQVNAKGRALRFVGVAEEISLMRLSKNQLDHLQQAARFPPGRTTPRGSTASPLAASADARPPQVMENVIRATEQVARAADNVIRAAQDVTPATVIPPTEVLEPAAPEILSPESASQRQVVQVARFAPRRRSRISLAVALLMLAFGAGAAMSWLLFGEPSRARDQVWDLVSLALQTGKGIPQTPGVFEPPSRRPQVALAPTPGAANATPSPIPSRPGAPPGAASSETADAAPHRAPATDPPRPRLLVAPPASVSTVETAPVKVTAPANTASIGIASVEPSTVAAAPPPGGARGVLENDAKPLESRPAERSLSGIVLGALPGGHSQSADRTLPDQPQSAVALTPGSRIPASELASPATESPPPESLAVCLAARPASLRLAREETARLLKRGEEFMGEGRVSAARLVFQRAAEACDVRAAFALGASYDPIMLQKLGVALLDPDVAAARAWYEKAKELGSSEASQELELLLNWHP
jgi:hypothetical protein